jgi:sulfopyruvate decarboxylase TPP-binding subunit
MLEARDITTVCAELDYSHLVWLPDSALGAWEGELSAWLGSRLLRVCREGEAWALAAGLHLGGGQPLVAIQNTGLFESGDALRNVLFDLGLPLSAIVGYRSYLVPGSTDSARRFTEPILNAWGLDYLLVDVPGMTRRVVDHLRCCREVQRAGIVLLAEGRG